MAKRMMHPKFKSSINKTAPRPFVHAKFDLDAKRLSQRDKFSLLTMESSHLCTWIVDEAIELKDAMSGTVTETAMLEALDVLYLMYVLTQRYLWDRDVDKWVAKQSARERPLDHRFLTLISDWSDSPKAIEQRMSAMVDAFHRNPSGKGV